MFSHFRDQPGIVRTKPQPILLSDRISDSGKGRTLCLVSDSQASNQPTTLQAARLFQKDGWKVTILDLLPAGSSTGLSYRNINKATAENDIFEYVRLCKTFGETNWYTPMQSLCVYQWLRSRTYDVIVFQHGFGAGHFCCVARNLGLAFQGTGLVVLADDPYAKWLEDAQYFPSQIRTDIEIDYFERQTVAQADAVLAFNPLVFNWMSTADWKLPEAKRLAVMGEDDGMPWGQWLVRQIEERRQPEVSDLPVSISVCIATYNRPKFLRETIASLLEQTIKDFEVVIVDDGSEDASVDLLRQEMKSIFVERDWHWEKQTNQGPSAARNYAASIAHGTHLLFMDDDNIALPDEIEIFTRAAMFGADIISCIFSLYPSEESASMAIARFPARTASTIESIAVHWIFYGPCLAANSFISTMGDANSLYRREVFEALGGFSGKRHTIHEDWQLLLRAAIAGYRHEVLPEVVMLYRFHDMRRTKTGSEAFQSQIDNLKPLANQLPPEYRSLLLGTRSVGANGGRPHPGRYPNKLQLPDGQAQSVHRQFRTDESDGPIKITVYCDDNSIMQACVTLVSAFCSAKAPLEAYVLSSMSDENAERITLIAQHFGFRIAHVPLREEHKPKLSQKSILAADEILSRWYIGDYLSKLSRVIYLENDMLVRHDLQELWQIHLSGNVLAAVSDFWIARRAECAKHLEGDYFNAGVMLIDLNAWRQHDIGDQTIKWHSQLAQDSGSSGFWEQMPLNKAVAGQWLPLSPTWNCMEDNLKQMTAHYHLTAKAAKSIQTDPAIRHFHGDRNPWSTEAEATHMMQEYAVYTKMVRTLLASTEDTIEESAKSEIAI